MIIGRSKTLVCAESHQGLAGDGCTVVENTHPMRIGLIVDGPWRVIRLWAIFLTENGATGCAARRGCLDALPVSQLRWPLHGREQ